MPVVRRFYSTAAAEDLRTPIVEETVRFLDVREGVAHASRQVLALDVDVVLGPHKP